MKTLLISLIEFINDFTFGYEDDSKKILMIYNYISFLETELKPWQFIPWDKDNNCPLEQPNNWSDYLSGDVFISKHDKLMCKQYQQASEEVLFEGFEVIYGKDNYIGIFYKDNELIYDTKLGFLIKQISDLSDKGIVLTPEGKKQSGL